MDKNSNCQFVCGFVETKRDEQVKKGPTTTRSDWYSTLVQRPIADDKCHLFDFFSSFSCCLVDLSSQQTLMEGLPSYQSSRGRLQMFTVNFSMQLLQMLVYIRMVIDGYSKLYILVEGIRFNRKEISLSFCSIVSKYFIILFYMILNIFMFTY